MSGRLQQTVTATTTQEVVIAPKLKTKLQKELRAYAQLQTEMDTLKAKIDARKSLIEAIRDEVGEESIQCDGFTVTLVAGMQKTLDRDKLVELGCAVAWLEEATVTKPKKAYTLITAPGRRSHTAE